MFGEYDRLLGCLQVSLLMQWHIAIVIAKMSSQRRPPLMPPSPDKAHLITRDFTEITVSNSDNDLYIVQAKYERFDCPMRDIADVEIWRTVLLWMFLIAFFFASLNVTISFDLGPVQLASAQVSSTFRDILC